MICTFPRAAAPGVVPSSQNLNARCHPERRARDLGVATLRQSCAGGASEVSRWEARSAHPPVDAPRKIFGTPAGVREIQRPCRGASKTTLPGDRWPRASRLPPANFPCASGATAWTCNRRDSTQNRRACRAFARNDTACQRSRSRAMRDCNGSNPGFSLSARASHLRPSLVFPWARAIIPAW